ncbi:Lipopolysaccharide biosynthesis protein RffA [hydrothermal vent metagenome]|uniref:Lipopolysaccharide biosynthesis protein RffA n=1 Tax=hydrothermal vent metagenome TaxID=652676 RepID=A0A1W1BIQ7_9ZZZZ
MDKIFLSPPHMSGKEQQYVNEVFESNYIAPIGAMINRFEAQIIEYTGSNYAVALSSATAGLHLALRVMGISEGDFVLASTFTFIGSVNAILYQGAKPIFVDSDESWNISPELLQEAINKAPKKPKALIITHLYGQVCKLDEIIRICKAEEILLIEDAAESLGASYHGQQSGTFGDMAVYSFNGNKILTTSGGGMLVSHHKRWIDKAKFLSTQAKEDKPYYEHKELGYNYRISNVLAAIGVGQMEVLEERVNRKRAIFRAYQEQLCIVNEIEFMPEILDSRGTRWLTTLILHKKKPQIVIEALELENIESRLLWKPMHLQPLFKDELSMVDGTSEKLFKQGLCLPSGTAMSEKDIERICNSIKKACV